MGHRRRRRLARYTGNIRRTLGSDSAQGREVRRGRNLKTLDGRRLNYSLGKAILQPEQGLYVTVKNGDSLDNRRHNLKVEGAAMQQDPGAVPVCLATDDDRAAYERKREKEQRARWVKPEDYALPEHVVRRQVEHYRRANERRRDSRPDGRRWQRRADGPELTVKPRVSHEDEKRRLQAVLVAELRRVEGVGQTSSG